jgi:hypothetical protein
MKNTELLGLIVLSSSGMALFATGVFNPGLTFNIPQLAVLFCLMGMAYAFGCFTND